MDLIERQETLIKSPAHYIPLQDIKDNARYLSMSLTKAIQDGVHGNPKVEVVEQYCDFWEVEDE